MSNVRGLHFCVDQDGWTGGYQLSIGDDTGGYRLCGPKYNGSSNRLITYIPSDSDLDAIEEYIAAERVRRRATGATDE